MDLTFFVSVLICLFHTKNVTWPLVNRAQVVVMVMEKTDREVPRWLKQLAGCKKTGRSVALIIGEEFCLNYLEELERENVRKSKDQATV